MKTVKQFAILAICTAAYVYLSFLNNEAIIEPAAGWIYK